MDDYLAELYGTAGNISSLGGEGDLEKSASAEFLVKLAREEGVDLDSMSDEEVGGILAEIEKQAEDGEIDLGEEGQVEEGQDEEGQQKLAEADFLGRTMAHAYVDEMAEIEKGAAAPGKIRTLLKNLPGRVSRLGGTAKGLPGRYGKNVSGRASEAKELVRDAVTGKGRIGGLSSKQRVRAALSAAKKVAPEAGVVAGLGAAGGTAAALSGREKKSFSEDFENAATERAYEMLGQAGYDVEKVAEADVDTRALQMLEQAGYQVQWNQ